MIVTIGAGPLPTSFGDRTSALFQRGAAAATQELIEEAAATVETLRPAFQAAIDQES